MAENLEQMVNSPEKKEEKKPSLGSSLSSEINQAGKGIMNTVLGAGAIGLTTRYFGLDGLVSVLSFPVGGMIEKKLMKDTDESKKQFKSENFRDESFAGAAFTVPLWYVVNYLRGLPGAFGMAGIKNALAVGALGVARRCT